MALIALGPDGVSRFQQISFDLPVLCLVFTFLIASLTTVIFGLWPAWQNFTRQRSARVKAGSAVAVTRHPLKERRGSLAKLQRPAIFAKTFLKQGWLRPAMSRVSAISLITNNQPASRAAFSRLARHTPGPNLLLTRAERWRREVLPGPATIRKLPWSVMRSGM